MVGAKKRKTWFCCQCRLPSAAYMDRTQPVAIAAPPSCRRLVAILRFMQVVVQHTWVQVMSSCVCTLLQHAVICTCWPRHCNTYFVADLNLFAFLGLLHPQGLNAPVQLTPKRVLHSLVIRSYSSSGSYSHTIQGNDSNHLAPTTLRWTLGLLNGTPQSIRLLNSVSRQTNKDGMLACQRSGSIGQHLSIGYMKVACCL